MVSHETERQPTNGQLQHRNMRPIDQDRPTVARELVDVEHTVQVWLALGSTVRYDRACSRGLVSPSKEVVVLYCMTFTEPLAQARHFLVLRTGLIDHNWYYNLVLILQLMLCSTSLSHPPPLPVLAPTPKAHNMQQSFNVIIISGTSLPWRQSAVTNTTPGNCWDVTSSTTSFNRAGTAVGGYFTKTKIVEHSYQCKTVRLTT